jgi:hypothetical protein
MYQEDSEVIFKTALYERFFCILKMSDYSLYNERFCDKIK